MIRQTHLTRLGIVAAAVAALVLPAPGVWAQDSGVPPVPSGTNVSVEAPPRADETYDAAYSDLFAAMQESVDQGQMVDGALAALAREFAATPNFAEAETMSPGIIEEIITGLRPVFTAQSDRVRALYTPATIALFARSLTPAEARDIAAFYRSELGRKLMGGLSRNYAPEQTLSNIQEGTPVTSEQVKADIGRATSAAMASLTDDDMIKIGKQAMATPALLKLGTIGSGVQELRVQMENEPLTAEEEAALIAMIEEVFARRFAQ